MVFLGELCHMGSAALLSPQELSAALLGVWLSICWSLIGTTFALFPKFVACFDAGHHFPPCAFCCRALMWCRGTARGTTAAGKAERLAQLLSSPQPTLPAFAV